jgi:DNA-3-methyladenine glycosylase
MNQERQEDNITLPVGFFQAETTDVARRLLGTRIERRFPDGTFKRVAIVETEAYLGIRDRAAHTWNGRRTRRVEPMWGPPGHAYVYFVYGMHHCLNVVTRDPGIPEAVLIRAAVPETWWLGEKTTSAELIAASGPGRLCRYLDIDRQFSGASLWDARLRLLKPLPRLFDVLTGPRVGVAYAGEAQHWNLRFAVADCPAVTQRKSLIPEIAGTTDSF